MGVIDISKVTWHNDDKDINSDKDGDNDGNEKDDDDDERRWE